MIVDFIFNAINWPLVFLLVVVCSIVWHKYGDHPDRRR